MPDDLMLRMQHYQFAARALPAMVFREPEGILRLLAGADRDRFLADIWTRTGAELGIEGSAGLPPTGAVHDLGTGHHAVVVTMPAPENAAEAHFVAIAFRPGNAAQGDRVKRPDVRYFALERSGFSEGPPITMLCEWTRDGTHINRGVGPAATVEAFLKALVEHLD